jgi:antitoxin YefM
MSTAIRQKAIVGKGGKVELSETGLLEGTPVEIIVLTESQGEVKSKDWLESLININADKMKHLSEDEVDALAVQAVREVRAKQP